MRELIMQGLKLEIFKSCLKCKRDTLHVGSSNFLQPPRYLIITIGRFENKHGILTKNRTLIPLDQQITSGPFNFRLQATIDHHGQFMSSGHYTTSVFCCSKVFYCNDGRVTIYNEDNIRDSHTVYIMIYKLVNHMWVCDYSSEDGSYIYSHGAGTCGSPWINRLRKRHRNLQGEQCVSSWWPCVFCYC